MCAQHPPSLIRDFAVRMKKAWALSYPLSADAQADPSLRRAHSHFVNAYHDAAHLKFYYKSITFKKK